MDRETWPSRGRVGLITEGDLAGRWVLLVAEQQDEFWTYFVSGPPVPGSGGPDYYINGDNVAQEIVDAWGVQWAEPADDVPIEQREFDMRRTWPRESGRLWIHTPVSQVTAALMWLIAAAAALGGVHTPSGSASAGSAVVGWTAVVLCLALALRALFLGVSLDGQRLIVRSWLRTRHLNASQVVDVRPTNYSGLWLRGSESGLLRTLSITTDTQTVTAWGVLGRHATVHRCARRLRQNLALPA